MQQRFPVQSDSIRYEQINIPGDQILPVINGYCSISNHLFYEVCKPEFKDELLDSASTSPLNTNWKAHVSCTQEAMPQLWDIVVPILLMHDCPAFKCVRLCNVPDLQKKTVFGQRCVDALQFTIYILPGEEDKYVAILQQIESFLLERNIPNTEGYQKHLFNSDKRIGIYTSVRCSRGSDGRYLSAEESLKVYEFNSELPVHNLVGAYEPFETMDSLKSMQLAELQLAQNRRRGPSMWQMAMQLQQEHEAMQQAGKELEDGVRPLTRSV